MKYEYRRDFDITYSQADRWLKLDLVNATSIVQEMNT